MASTLKTLGESAPAATTNTDLYTVPASRNAVVSTLSICNRGSGGALYRVAIRTAGASLANQHYVCYDCAVAGNDTVFLTVGMTLAATDVVTVYSNSANISYKLFGSENTL